MITDVDGLPVGTYTAKITRFGQPNKSSFGDGKMYRYVDFEVIGGEYAGEPTARGVGVDILGENSRFGPGSIEYKMLAALVSPKTPLQFQDELIASGEDTSDEALYGRLIGSGARCQITVETNKKTGKTGITGFAALRNRAPKATVAAALDEA